MAVVFRPTENGYDQMEVLTRIDEFEQLKDKVRKGKLTVEEAAEQAQALAEKPISTGIRGFDPEEVDTCFGNYVNAIRTMQTALVTESRTLPTAFRGYHKMQVLTYVDALNALIAAAEGGSITPSDALVQAEKVMEKPLEKAMFGFSISDTDAYLKSLMAKLRSFS